MNAQGGNGRAPGYPSSISLFTAVEKRAFRDPLLRSSLYPADAVFRDTKNKKMLVPDAQGAFAAVFKLIVAGEDKAVRVYKAGKHAQWSQAHYGILQDYFHRERPSCLVGFRHYADEIEVKGGWYPILTMEWVPGQTLGAWVLERARAGDGEALRKMADCWVALVEELQRFQVAHGDLQHDNVLVVNGGLKLIDYDGMYVPAYSKSEQHAGECGVDAYQHPERKGKPLSPALDHFAAWIILIALRALAADPSLCERHLKDEKERPLLFTDENTKKTSDPEHCAALWDELQRSPDADVRKWAGRLRDCLDGPFEEIPPFKIDSEAFGRLRKLKDILLNNTLPRDEWDQLWMRTWDETLLADCPDADDFRTTHEEVRQRVARMRKLEGAIRNGNALKVARLAQDRSLAGYPPLERARTEMAPLFERGKRVKRLLRALRKGDDKTVLAALDLPTVAEFAWQFLPFRLPIRTLVESILAAARLQAGQMPYQLDTRASQITLSWTGWAWPHFGLPDRWCRIALHPRRFLHTPDEDSGETYRPGQRSCRAGGYTLQCPEGASRLFVTIWPTVTLDWKSFGRDEAVGSPLEIGPIQLANGKGLRRWWPWGQKDE